MKRSLPLRGWFVALLFLMPAGAFGGGTAQQLTMLKELLPRLKTVTVFCNVAEMQPALRDLKSATDSVGLQLSVFDVKSFPELRTAFLSFSSKTVDVIWMLPDKINFDKFNRRFLQENCLRKKIPLHAYSKDLVKEGSLMYMAIENGQPVYYINKAASGLMDYTPPSGMESKITLVE